MISRADVPATHSNALQVAGGNFFTTTVGSTMLKACRARMQPCKQPRTIMSAHLFHKAELQLILLVLALQREGEYRARNRYVASITHLCSTTRASVFCTRCSPTTCMRGGMCCPWRQRQTKTLATPRLNTTRIPAPHARRQTRQRTALAHSHMLSTLSPRKRPNVLRRQLHCRCVQERQHWQLWCLCPSTVIHAMLPDLGQDPAY